MNDKEVGSRLRILLVEDNDHDRRLFHRAFRKKDMIVEIIDCRRGQEAIDLLQADREVVDVVVSDNGLPGMTGLELFQELTESGIALPFILLTGAGNELLAVEAIKLGVDDYLAKSCGPAYIEQIPTAIARVLGVHRDRAERERAEAALKAEEERFRLLMEAVQDYAIFMLDPEGIVTSWNSGAQRINGYSDEQIIGKHFSVFYLPDDVRGGKPREQLEKAIQEGSSVDESRRLRMDGTQYWANVVISAVRDQTTGKLLGFANVARDITDARKAQRRLERSEARLVEAQRIARLGSWDWDLVSGKVAWSDEMYRILGLSPQSVASYQTLWERVCPEDRQIFDQRVKSSIADGVPQEVEYRIAQPNGDIHHIHGELQLEFDNEGEPRRLIGTAQDVSERKRQEERNRFLSESVATALLAAMDDYDETLQHLARLHVPFFADWCVIDLMGEDGSLRRVAVAHVSPAQETKLVKLNDNCTFTGKLPQLIEQVIGRRRSKLVEEIEDPLVLSAANDEASRELLHELNPQSVICVPLVMQKRLIGVLQFVYADSGRNYAPTDLAFAESLAHRAAITIENARVYEAARQADRRKDEFLAMLAHELRNPLAPIRNALELMRVGQGDADLESNARATIERQVEHMVRLVDDLLDLSRVMRGKITLRKERVSLETVIQRALEASSPLIEMRKHELSLTLPDEDIWVNGDEVRLAQVVANLLTNSAKYTNEGGHIWLTCEQQGDDAVIRVRDDGIGIQQEMLPQIFDLFHQVDSSLDHSHGGIGIGLTLVRRLVDLHGGKVMARSAGLGKGSEFIVRMPMLRPARKAADQPTPSETPAVTSSAQRILVVDDNLDAAAMLSALLRLYGHQVFTAHDGLDAVRMAHEHHPDAILLDIGLPGLNGYQVASQLRDEPEFAETLLIAVTGFGQSQDQERSRQAGFDLHLVKPVQPQVIREVLAKRSAQVCKN